MKLFLVLHSACIILNKTPSLLYLYDRSVTRRVHDNKEKVMTKKGHDNDKGRDENKWSE